MTQDTHAGAGGQPAPALQSEALRIAMHLRQRAQLSRPGNLDSLSASGANELERQHAELSAAQSEAKHWRSNHDNVVARLRIFTQRSDIPKELADRLPWYRELVRLQAVEAQAAAKCLHQGAEAAAVAALKGLLSLVRREAPQLSGKVLGDAESAIAALQAAPPAPAGVAVLYVSPEQLEKHLDLEGPENAEAGRYLPARKTPAGKFTQPLYALAAAPAQAVEVPEGVSVDAWRKGARFALEAVSKVDSICWLTDSMKEICIKQAAEAVIAERDRMTTAPAQEHATQLAQAQGCTRSHPHENMSPMCVLRTEIARLNHAAAIAQATAAPAQAQEDARDAAFEAVRNRLCGLQRYSFVLDDDGVVRRAQDRSGNWIEFDDAHELFDPVAVDAAIDEARAAQGEA